MDKEYLVVTEENMKKLLECFADEEELNYFVANLECVGREMGFLNEVKSRIETSQIITISLKQIITIIFFCRDHIELIHDLIKTLKWEEMDEKQIDDLKEGTDYIGFTD